MKSGKLNSHALKYWAHELTHNGGRWQVGGPYCRVEFRKISLTSDNEVKAYLLTQGWQPDEYNFSKKTGKVTSPKFTESSLDSIKGDTGQLIAKHMKASQRLSTMAGWLAHIGDDSRLHGEVNPQACPTVRMTHKILVNVPSPEKQSFFAEQMREIFIAPKGYKVVSADIASCQLRALCHYMGDENFTYAVVHGNKDEGTDLHTLNMKMAGLPTRGHAKNFIYAFLFGAGPTKIGRMVGGGVNEGKRIIAKYLENVPKLKALKEGLEATWKSRGYLIGVDGRKIYIHSKKDLLVYMLQSIEAMIIKIAVCLVDHWITQEGLDARQVCVYHDEFSFEAREDHADRVAFLLEEAIKQAGETLKLNPPAAGEAAVGDNWLEVH
jgi:DNA polymerase I-like protein with 3'-5' exonuclease and polymerase domains